MPPTMMRKLRVGRWGIGCGAGFLLGGSLNTLATDAAAVGKAFSGAFSGVSDVLGSSRLRVVSWNVAAVNNNPFEYWITHPNPAYKQLMEAVEQFITEPGEDDVMVHELFTDQMFQKLLGRMSEAGIEELVAAEDIWERHYRSRRVVSEFLRDPVIGKKRLASMPDRITNTIQLASGGKVFRPTVINCYGEDMGSLTTWFDSWLKFFFDTKVDVDGKGPKPVHSLLQHIRQSKYPAVSKEEEAASIPLQLVMQGIFDSILVNLMQKKGGDTWQGLRRDICISLNSKKNERVMEILSTTYQDVDVVFLQEAGNELLTFLRRGYATTHHVVVPRSYSNKRAQNSIMLLRRTAFTTPEEVDIPADGWEAGDLLVVRSQVQIVPGSPELTLASFHGDTNGLLTKPMLSQVWKHLPTKRLVFGMDANTHERKSESTAHVTDFQNFYEGLGLQAAWGKDNLHTTFNARTYLQPQLNKAAKSSELTEKGDRNPKDFVLCTSHFKVGAARRDNTGSGTYLEDVVFPSLEFPSDHAAVSVDLLMLPELASEGGEL
ncbi:unnamed protein product [Polarella glacialis]|uniref:Endonuclease/exonuclease/phosphatase domain-containing protein n=1 Tax=Polarella glacialis TaxID=89957 RepID=A0A813E3X9_POLGL|nr:unnamed protein product [Polarella glacialis]